MKALITGAAGFIGSHVAESLLADGWEVLGVDNFDPFYDPALKRENIRGLKKNKTFKLVEADIRDREQIESAVGSAKIDVIVHMAARAGVRPSIELPRLYADVNVSGTVEMLELARKREVPRFVFASSSSVYGEREGSPFREEDIVDHPISPYAATKKAGGAPLLHLPPPLQVLGRMPQVLHRVRPRQRPEMAIHKFARAISEGEPITLFGDGSSRRDYTYVDDVVAGVVAAVDRASGYRIYNLGNNRTIELRELIRLLEEDLGKKADVKHLPAQPGDVPLTCADIRRSQEELGYNPGVPIERGLELFVEWFEKKKRPRRKPA